MLFRSFGIVRLREDMNNKIKTPARHRSMEASVSNMKSAREVLYCQIPEVYSADVALYRPSFYED